MEQSSKSSLLIPAAIIIAGVFIAGAILITKQGSPSDNTPTTQTASAEKMQPITEKDHIWGNPNAKVKLVVYSDTECPFCQAFDSALKQAMDVYGKDGSLAIIYRHFVVVGNPKYHPKAAKEAEALECVAELGGNDKFWQYQKLIVGKKDFTKEPVVGVDPKDLPKLAASIGVNQAEFTKCLDSGKYTKFVTDSFQLAVDAGGRGTPYTVVVTGDAKVPITAGAIPFSQLKTIIDAALKQ